MILPCQGDSEGSETFRYEPEVRQLKTALIPESLPCLEDFAIEKAVEGVQNPA